jgi:hypothetical protein
VSAVVSNGLSVDGARRLTERIRLVAQNVADNVEKLRDLVSEARESDVHQVLGYASWTAYLKDVFGDEPLRLARDVRQELVAELSAQGMSTRAIAPIVGVSVGTIHTDRQVFSSEHVPPASVDVTPTLTPRADDWTPSTVNTSTGEVIEPVTGTTEITETHTIKTVTGLDGKTYKRAEPAQPRRRSITDQFFDAAFDLEKVIDRLTKLAADDRMATNKNQIALKHQNDLARIAEALDGILQTITN